MSQRDRLRIVVTRLLACLAAGGLATGADAAPEVYQIDPSHTYPSFEADHLGLSLWRGKFNSSRGSITLDREVGRGEVQVTTDIRSVDFGLEAMNRAALGQDILSADAFPLATFRGRLEGFYANGIPGLAVGELTLHGVTRPLTLNIQRFRCAPHPMLRREVCGADVSGQFRRDDFGIDAGRAFGFDMEVTLRIQVEAIAVER